MTVQCLHSLVVVFGEIFGGIIGETMNGTKLLIEAAVKSRNERVRDLAISELVGKNSKGALEYVARKSMYEGTRRYVTLCLYQMKAVAALHRLLEDGPKDVRDYADVLLREMNNEYEETRIEIEK